MIQGHINKFREHLDTFRRRSHRGVGEAVDPGESLDVPLPGQGGGWGTEPSLHFHAFSLASLLLEASHASDYILSLPHCHVESSSHHDAAAETEAQRRAATYPRSHREEAEGPRLQPRLVRPQRSSLSSASLSVLPRVHCAVGLRIHAGCLQAGPGAGIRKESARAAAGLGSGRSSAGAGRKGGGSSLPPAP